MAVQTVLNLYFQNILVYTKYNMSSSQFRNAVYMF